VYGPQGGTTGKVKYSAAIIVNSYEIDSEVGDAGKFSMEATVTGPVTRGTF
jgi:hypothetical protein